jgi:integrase
MTRDADGKASFTGDKMRTANQWEADLERLVHPVFGRRQIGEIKRLEIVRLLDQIEDERGAHMALKVHKYLSRVFNWHASRSDDFRSPLVRMGRTVEGTVRDRTLTEDEVRAIWQAAETFQGPW